MKTKTVMAFVLIVAAVLIGMTFIMSSNASAAVAAPGAGIDRPTMNSTVVAPKVLAPRPFITPIFNPFFFPRFSPFFFDEPFFFEDDVGFGRFEED